MQYLEAKVQSVRYWSTERVRYGTENIIPYFRTVLFLKIPYVIPYRTFFQNLTVPYRNSVPNRTVAPLGHKTVHFSFRTKHDWASCVTTFHNEKTRVYKRLNKTKVHRVHGTLMKIDQV